MRAKVLLYRVGEKKERDRALREILREMKLLTLDVTEEQLGGTVGRLVSSNATAVQVMKLIGGPSEAYEQATTKMGFKKLKEEDSYQIGSLSIGGMVGGVSVREMAAGFAYMGNGGLDYEPYTYYYVTDSEGNGII